jgi:hypothetical protein
MNTSILGAISFANETTWGVSVTPTKSIDVDPGDGIQTDPDKQYISTIKGQIEKNVEAFIGQRKHTGPFDMPGRPTNLGYLYKSAFGSVSSALKSGETIVYQHTLSEAVAKPSLTIEQNILDIVARFAGCIVLSVKLSCKTGDYLKVATAIQAKSRATATAITPVFETIRAFNFADIGSGFKIGGTSIAEVESFEIEYKNNVNFKHTVASNDAGFFVAKPSEVTGKIDMLLNSNTTSFYTDYLAGTQRAVDITFTGDAIGVSSNYGLNINVPKADFKTVTDPIRDDYNLLTVNFEAIKDTSTSKQISMLLTNLLASY